jgi:ornithine carbamoyltransferase
MNAYAQVQSHTLNLSSDLLTGAEWSASQVHDLFRLAVEVKAHPDRYRLALSGRSLAMIFEKPSLRTRVTFEVGIASMGGTPVYLDHADTHLGDRESIPDVGRCLSRWVHGIVARVFSQDALRVLAEHASVPVINALSDVYHPCQTLCDFFTLEEKFGSARGLKLAYIGDGNNVCHSLMVAGARLGAHIRIATPAGYEPDSRILAATRLDAAATQGSIELFHSPEEAVAGAQAVYTDVWASMGQESEAAARAAIFAPYQVNAKLMTQAAPEAVFLHCLPAHRGSEVTNDVIESPRSIVFDEAENRLHVQKAILLMLLS